jgi:DNA-binding LytR/AlgR family response regulator
MIRSFIQFTAHPSVQQLWGEWLRPRDEPSPAGTDGAIAQSDGDARLSVRTVFAVSILLIVFSAVVGTFSSARDIAGRLGSPQNMWEPALWQATSSVVVIALLPLARHGALLIASGRNRPFTLAFALVALALTYSTLHIAGMGCLREWAYGFAGYTYKFPWARQIPYELRKDLFSFTAFVVVFWLGRRAVAQRASAPREDAPNVSTAHAANSQFWLRDGRISVLVDANDIVSVSSAGNYVEYKLTGGRKHLVRATLQSQEARLAPLGIVRVHRSRLVNLKRVVALEGRSSGDFEVRLDTGEIVAGSRRFKSTVAEIATG